MEEDLLRRAQACDPGALTEIFDAYYERIYNYIYRRTGQANLSDDLAGEVFLRLLEGIRNGRGPQTNLLAWLYRVAHNLIVDHFRRQSKAATQPLEEWTIAAPDRASDVVESQIVQEQLQAALVQLTPEQQQVVVLKFVEGLSNAQVGIILGKPEGAIKSLQHRALAAMRRHIERGQTGLVPSEIKGALE